MRYMIIVKATCDSEAGKMPSRGLLAEMGRFHEELAKAGILRDASGLKPTSAGWRIEYDGRETTVVDGPFPETKELVAGYTLIEVGSRDEALEWTRRFPNPSIDGGMGQIEVREFFELDDFEPGEDVDRFRDLNLPSQKMKA